MNRDKHISFPVSEEAWNMFMSMQQQILEYLGFNDGEKTTGFPEQLSISNNDSSEKINLKLSENQTLRSNQTPSVQVASEQEYRRKAKKTSVGLQQSKREVKHQRSERTSAFLKGYKVTIQYNGAENLQDKTDQLKKILIGSIRRIEAASEKLNSETKV